MKYSQTSTLFCRQDLAKRCNFKLQAEISSKEQEYGGDMGVSRQPQLEREPTCTYL